MKQIKLETPKFQNLRDNGDEFLKHYLVFAQEHGFEAAVRQLRASDIVISRNKEKRYDKLFKSCINLLYKTFPKKYKQIKQLKVEAILLQELYKKIFFRVPQFGDKTLLAMEKAGFLIFLENYLTVNRHINIANDENQLCNYLLTPEIQSSVDATEYLNQWNWYRHYIEEQTREIRDILLYFHVKSDIAIEEIELSIEEIQKKEVYIPIINEFWNLGHINELWSYVGMSIEKNATGITYNSFDKEKYKSWMIANYRSRQSHLWRANKAVKAQLRSKTRYNNKNYDGNIYMCSEYFYALPWEIFINDLCLEKWLKAYEIIQGFAQDYMQNRIKIKNITRLDEWFSIQSKEGWINVLKTNSDLSSKEAAKIFESWVLNNDKKDKEILNKGDIFDHPFYRIDRNRYLLFSSIASQLDPIQCLRSLANQYGEKIVIDNTITSAKYLNPLEREVGIGLKKRNVPFITNLFIEKEDGVVNPSNREGEFDLVFQLEQTLFFVECKHYLQPFYFDKYQELCEKLDDESKMFKSKINHVVKQRYTFGKDGDVSERLFSKEWWKQKSVEKILITSCCLGEYINMNGIHMFDIEVFNAWLFNKEIVIKDEQTGEIVQVIHPKQDNSLLQRFYSLQKEIPIIKLKQRQCKLMKRAINIAGTTVEVPHYAQLLVDQLFL